MEPTHRKRELVMSPWSTGRLVCIAGTLGVAGLGTVSSAAQEIATTIEVSSERSFVPLQSYVVGEVNGSLLFFCGLSDFGLHPFGESAFPAKRFSSMVH